METSLNYYKEKIITLKKVRSNLDIAINCSVFNFSAFIVGVCLFELTNNFLNFCFIFLAGLVFSIYFWVKFNRKLTILENENKYLITQSYHDVDIDIVQVYDRTDFPIMKLYFKNELLHNEKNAAIDYTSPNKDRSELSNRFYLFGKKVSPFSSAIEGAKLAHKMQNLSTFS